jgi:ATPase subunit of ABC transporter with duplicated ATPase domains
MRVSLAGVARHHGAQVVLEQVDLEVGPHGRLGLVGPNGVGKSTLLRLLAGLEEPDAGVVSRAPAGLTVGYVPQEREARPGETLAAYLARRTGVAAAERELQESAATLAAASSRPGTEPTDDRLHSGYAQALERYLALGGADLEPRARAVCADLRLAVPFEQEMTSLSGGEAARAALAAVLLARFDLLLLDEPTNDLDFDGLERLERFVSGYAGALVVVSHDRAFLDRTVTRILAIEPGTRRVREWAGGWSDYAAARDAERAAAYARLAEAQEQRAAAEALLRRRRNEARAHGPALGKATGGADRRATNALRTKVRQAERRLERMPLPDKPFEPWELRLDLSGGGRPGDHVLSLQDAVAVRGDFRLGPLGLDLAPGERLAVTGPNGSGKSTLLGMLLGDVPLSTGTRHVGRRTAIGSLAQERVAYAGETALLDAFRGRTGLVSEEARTLLAKFGLGAEHVHRSCATLSPGERTRAHLAELQARGVNLLVLDEPTNHLDLEAIEQLEQALATFEGTIVVVSHDRRFLEAVAPTRTVALEVPAILRSRPWPSRSERPAPPAATSGARSTRSRRRG